MSQAKDSQQRLAESSAYLAIVESRAKWSRKYCIHLVLGVIIFILQCGAMSEVTQDIWLILGVAIASGLIVVFLVRAHWSGRVRVAQKTLQECQNAP